MEPRVALRHANGSLIAAFLDTNVIVYAYDRGEPAKAELARSILRDAPEPPIVSTQVLAETYWVTTRRLASPLLAARAAEIVAALSELTVVGADAALVRDAIALARRRQLALWDAMIVRAAQVAACDILLSEDMQHGAVFDDVHVENPFREVG